jgi:proteasome activator subunit 4
VFFYKNLLSLSPEQTSKVMRVLLDCLANENVEVREIASKVLSGVLRTSQRQNIIPLKNRFVTLAKKTILPPRADPEYAANLRTLHSAILGLCALMQSFPYSVEPWLPPLTEGACRNFSPPAALF